MNHSSAIGGYFEVERFRKDATEFHDAPALVSGRACVHFLTERVRPRHVLLPYYCCDSLVSPFQANGVSISRYALDENFEIRDPVSLPPDCCLVYINYFGLKTNYQRRLRSQLGDALWLDNTQAFFAKESPTEIAFNSARKFFGVADGAYLSGASDWSDEIKRFPVAENPNITHLLKRRFEGANAGYEDFKRAEALIGSEQKQVSYISRMILQQIDYESAALIRKRNFKLLHQTLGATNKLSKLIDEDEYRSVPFCYPYLPSSGAVRHQDLWDEQVFAALLWPECAQFRETACFASQEHKNLLPLPMDHRYSEGDMTRISSVVLDSIS